MKIFFKNNKFCSKGFTLIELLVVVAIISLLSSIVFASLNTARAKARNAKRLQDISSYALAAELAYDKNGEYPDPGDTNNYCLGHYGVPPNDKCWLNNGIAENASLNDALDDYIPTLPAGDVVFNSAVGDFEGYIYTCITRTNNILCSSFWMRWHMEGTFKSCGPGTVDTPPGGNDYAGGGTTFCRLVR